MSESLSPPGQMLSNWIGGTFVPAEGAPGLDVTNPSTTEVIERVPLCDASHTDAAVAAAREAFPSWSSTPVLQRVKVLHAYRALLSEHSESLAQLICLENGKTFQEAKGDVARGIEVVEFACGTPHLLKGEQLGELADQLSGGTTREPLGVCAGITPFNFPAMVPMWMYPLAIACGNTFVLKPSEKTPLTANRLAELFAQAGLPAGVLNVVHGQKEVVDALCTHPDVQAVSFVGSSAVAQHVYALGTQHKKRVQAAGGAKNVLLVMPDADLAAACTAIMGSAFGCAGQRCMAGSILMGVGDVAEPLQARLVEAMDRLQLDDTSTNKDAGMGPVIDQAARDRLFDVIEREDAAGRAVVRDGRTSVPDGGYFVRPTLFDHARPGDAIFETELFGPLLSMARPSSLDEGLAWMNGMSFGNGATIFTRSGAAAQQFARQIECGMVGINVGVPAPMAVFPFSGWKDSFFGSLHVQGTEGVQFYTRQKVILSRWDNDASRQMGW